MTEKSIKKQRKKVKKLKAYLSNTEEMARGIVYVKEQFPEYVPELFKVPGRLEKVSASDYKRDQFYDSILKDIYKRNPDINWEKFRIEHEITHMIIEDSGGKEENPPITQALDPDFIRWWEMFYKYIDPFFGEFKKMYWELFLEPTGTFRNMNFSLAELCWWRMFEDVDELIRKLEIVNECVCILLTQAECELEEPEHMDSCENTESEEINHCDKSQGHNSDANESQDKTQKSKKAFIVRTAAGTKPEKMTLYLDRAEKKIKFKVKGISHNSRTSYSELGLINRNFKKKETINETGLFLHYLYNGHIYYKDAKVLKSHKFKLEKILKDVFPDIEPPFIIYIDDMTYKADFEIKEFDAVSSDSLGEQVGSAEELDFKMHKNPSKLKPHKESDRQE